MTRYQATAQGRRRGRRVLVVDDDPQIAALLVALLSDEGHVVEAATHSLRVFDAARAFAPDLILMDIGMPYLSGFDQMKLLSLDESTAHVPVIVVTAHRDALDGIDRASLPSIVDCVYKPFDATELLAKIGTLPPRR